MSQNNQTIVVPIDFSEQSKIALNQSFNLARLANASITLVYVIDEDTVSSLFSFLSHNELQEELMKTGILKKLEDLVDETGKKGEMTFHFKIEKGKVYDQIVKVADEMNAAFIVMGTSGASTIKKKFIGSNAVRVISDAHCPVITIKGKEHRQGCDVIVLPLDLSKETKEKVDECILIAKFFNSTVRVMSVVDTKDEFLLNKITRQMEQVVNFISENGIKCEGEFHYRKDISEGVLEYARKVHADLIIIMTQQELEWTEYFIGTESQQIIHSSDIPVCSIRPVAKKDTTEFVIS